MLIADIDPEMCARAIMNEKARSRITAQQVADLAGVSRSAVSRCFNGGGRVSKDKRDRIFTAAADLGYRPNGIARSLTGQPTDLVALVTTEILSYQSNDQVRQVTLCLAEAGKRALVIPVGDDTTIDESSLRALDYQVDAIVVMGGSVSKRVVDLLTAMRVPLFLFGRDQEGEASVGISSDNAKGGAMAARYLLRMGRRRLAYVGKKTHSFADRTRRDGFAGEIHRHGLELHDLAEDESTYDGGRRAASALFSAVQPPDAVFCFNDTVAIGALQAAREFKLRVPADVAIIGFDNQPMAAWHVFDLTTIGCDPEALARLTTEKIRCAVELGEHQPGTFYLEPELIVRGTTP